MKKKKVICIGGGTGLSTILKGLKKYDIINTTAIVTVMDDGGSSGRLKREFGVLPPGDIRNCLLALSNKEDIFKKIFSYRFPVTKKNPEVGGHSLGNLLMVALTDIYKGFDKAIKKISEILDIKGKVLPITLQPTDLAAVLEDGKVVFGETKISSSTSPIKRMFLNPSVVRHYSEVVNEIKDADMIVIGPGSLYTSILPNLVIKEVREEIAKNKDSIKVYICNIMTQPGETDNYSVVMHIKKIYEHCENKFMFDYVFVNSGKLPYRLLKKYKKVKSFPVEIDSKKELKKLIKKDIIIDNFVDKTKKIQFVRHDSDKVAEMLISLF
ncbi:MAG: uridine diphosphate-N-acetylglucosamine-binding protein YvcK [Endomicrobia bacterium]|nr:uridine diphosphate-N-acetylglucosamine-binding protein YvcK [Endomicrobiia bacterium]